MDIKEALSDSTHDIDNRCSLLVCHKLNVDRTVVVSELTRLKMTLNNVNECCTMLDTTNYCKLMPMLRANINGHHLNNYIGNVLMLILRMHIIVIMML